MFSKEKFILKYTRLPADEESESPDMMELHRQRRYYDPAAGSYNSQTPNSYTETTETFYSYSDDNNNISGDFGLVQRTCCCGKVNNKVTVEPVALIYFLSAGVLAFVSENYVYQARSLTATGYTIKGVENGSDYDEEFFYAPNYLRIMQTIAVTLPGIIMALFTGSFSDKYGRRLVLFIPAVGILLRAVITLVVTWFQLSAWGLFGASFIEGMSGGPCIMTAALFGYMSHVTSSERRTVRFYVLQVLASLAVLFSRLLEFLCGSVMSCDYILLMVILLLILNMWIIQAYLDEPTNTHPNHDILSWDHLTVTLRVFQQHANRGNVWKLRSLIVVVFLLATSVDVTGGVARDLDASLLDPYQVSGFISFVMLLGALTALLFLWLLKSQVSDYVFMLLGLCAALALKIWTIIPSEYDSAMAVTIGYALLGCLISLPVPLVRSALSKVAKQRDQGAVSAAVSVAQESGLLLASIVMPFLTQGSAKPAAVIEAILLVVAIALASYIYWRARREHIQREDDSGLLAGIRGYTPIL